MPGRAPSRQRSLPPFAPPRYADALAVPPSFLGLLDHSLFPSATPSTTVPTPPPTASSHTPSTAIHNGHFRGDVPVGAGSGALGEVVVDGFAREFGFADAGLVRGFPEALVEFAWEP